jgi:hypothetical protein
MRRLSCSLAVALLFATYLPVAAAIAIGQTDNFEDGTTQNWVVGIALGAAHPAPPANIADGGPGGVGDNFLQLTAVGGQGAGNRLSVLNLVQWAGDYTAAGVTSISMDLNNLGTTDLAIRLYFEDPQGAPPANQAITGAFLLPASSGWVNATFAVDASSLITLLGDATALLSNTTALRIIHSPAEDFRGPPIVAQLGVDNISAGAATIPVPSTLALLGVVALGWLGQRVSPV